MKKLYGIIMFVILLCIDQFTKFIIISNFRLGEEKEIIEKVFSLEYIRNTGAAWGIMPNGTTFFAIFSIIVCFFLIILYFKIPLEKKYISLSGIVILLISGAVGNLIDRCTRKYVVDFIYFKLIDFPVFNVADIYVTIAGILLIIVVLFYYKDEDFYFISLRKQKKNDVQGNIGSVKDKKKDDKVK